MNSRIDSSSFHSFEEDQESNIEQQYQEHDMESANKLVAMNPSGVVEAFENERKLKCTGDVCVLEDEDTGRENMANKSDSTSSSSSRTPPGPGLTATVCDNASVKLEQQSYYRPYSINLNKPLL